MRIIQDESSYGLFVVITVLSLMTLQKIERLEKSRRKLSDQVAGEALRKKEYSPGRILRFFDGKTGNRESSL
ncbi:hypothetical protein [Salimicrobium halophilum]|uniref:hypothetical protein n=1 Tax=Salimicrobium halophilum TaxID=86666 RepID=UPI000B8939CE|nr:hypothetical protein [Salimicrobium halophilum]